MKIPIHVKTITTEPETSKTIITSIERNITTITERIVISEEYGIGIHITLPLTFLLISALFLTYITRPFNNLESKILWLISLSII